MQQLTSPKLGIGTIDIQHLKLWFAEAKGGWTELPGHYQPAYFGTGVKIHAIRYRQVPPDAGLEEYVR